MFNKIKNYNDGGKYVGEKGEFVEILEIYDSKDI